MHEVLTGLWRLSLLPFDALNVYQLGDVLVDSGVGFTKKKLLKALEGRIVAAVAATHAHFDHQSACRKVCENFDIPLWCGDGDRSAVESGDLTQVMANPESWVSRVGSYFGGPGHPVSRSLL